MSYFFRLICIVHTLAIISASYLEFKLVKTAINQHTQSKQSINCIHQSSINAGEMYRQVCFQKDISYLIEFVSNRQIQQHLYLAADFTTTFDWIKAQNCKIQNSHTRCTPLTQFKDQNIIKRPQRPTQTAIDIPVDTIIKDSFQIIPQQSQYDTQLSFTVKDSNRFNNLFQLTMLGIFIYGQTDTVQLQNTSFILAQSISQRVDYLMDGAVSLKYDQNAQNSFLNEVFKYVKTQDNAVTIFLGVDNTLTIGDMTAKYTKKGYSSIKWIPTSDQGHGKLSCSVNIGIEANIDESEQQDNETLPAIITLSASYVGLPKQVIDQIIVDAFSKTVLCNIDDKTLYVQCLSSNKNKQQKILKNNLIFRFSGINMMISMKKLVLSQDDLKIVFNIKKTYSNIVILGEPIFLQYFIAINYNKNMMGFAPKKQQQKQVLIGVVQIVRFMCTVFLLASIFVFYSSFCLKKQKKHNKSKVYSQNKIKSQYVPIQQNYSECSKEKIKQIMNS